MHREMRPSSQNADSGEIVIMRIPSTNSLGFKKFLGNVKKQYDEKQERRRVEEQELQEYEGQVDDLLAQFEIPELDDFFLK